MDRRTQPRSLALKAWLTVLVVLATLATCGPAQPQDPVAVTLPEAVQTALARHPDSARAFELGAAAEFRAPMARAVIGGLITSTLLTLIVVPVVCTYLDDVSVKVVRWHLGQAAARMKPGGLTSALK